MKRILPPFFGLLIFITGCGRSSEKKTDYTDPFKNGDSALTVAIVPYHDFRPAWINLVRRELEGFYGIKTLLLPKAEMPDSCKKPYKNRYNAGGILQHLNVIKPKDVQYILALTTEGIAIEKGKYKEWGILGLGTCPGPCCVISTANMGKYDDRFKDRLVKVCLHEMGHNFGLPHCDKKDMKCLMRDANGTVLTIDEDEKYLCKYCAGFLKVKGFKLGENE